MRKATAVADATVLIFLAKLGRLEDLWTIYDPVLVPTIVHEEVVLEGKRSGYPDALAIERAIGEGHLQLVEADTGDTRAPEGHPRIEELGLAGGDRDVASTALTVQADVVLTDDGVLRSVLKAAGLTVRGTLSFLVHALSEGELTFEAYLDELEHLSEEAGFRMSPRVFTHAVRKGRQIAGGD